MNYMLPLQQAELERLITAIKEDISQWERMKADYRTMTGDNSIANEMVKVADINVRESRKLLTKLNNILIKAK